MTTILKMNRNRQINLPSAFVAKLSLGEDSYFKADLKGNHIVLTPIDPVERVFSKESIDLVEEVFKRERSSAKPVSSDWVKKIHRSAS